MKVIITGTTGMVGHAVLIEALEDDSIKEVLIINRKPLGITHPKLVEILHKDFSDFSAIEDKLSGYDGCYYCMGVSSSGMSEEQYTHITYDFTYALASVLYKQSPQATFIYVSGDGSDSSEKGKVMWARVKGKTENMVLKMGFKDAYAFRAGAILPTKGVKSKTKLYHIMYLILTPFNPLLRRLNSITTSERLGKAMLSLTKNPQNEKIVYNRDINLIALRYINI